MDFQILEEFKVKQEEKKLTDLDIDDLKQAENFVLRQI